MVRPYWIIYASQVGFSRTRFISAEEWEVIKMEMARLWMATSRKRCGCGQKDPASLPAVPPVQTPWHLYINTSYRWAAAGLCHVVSIICLSQLILGGVNHIGILVIFPWIWRISRYCLSQFGIPSVSGYSPKNVGHFQSKYAHDPFQ